MRKIQDLLQPLDLHAERGLRDVGSQRGVPEASMPLDGDEIPQLLHGQRR